MEILQGDILFKFVKSAFHTEQMYLQIYSVHIVKEDSSILLKAMAMTLNYMIQKSKQQQQHRLRVRLHWVIATACAVTQE